MTSDVIKFDNVETDVTIRQAQKQARLQVYYNKINFDARGTSEQVHPAEGARWCRPEETPTTLKRTESTWSGGGNFQWNTLYKRVTYRLPKIKHACVVDLSQYFVRSYRTVLVFSSVTGKWVINQWNVNEIYFEGPKDFSRTWSHCVICCLFFFSSEKDTRKKLGFS